MVDDVTLEPAAAAQEHRRRTLWGVLAALVVLGGALAVVAAGRDDGGVGPPALPVSLDAPARGEATELAGDSSMRPAWITYVPGDGLPALGGEAAAYRSPGALDEGRIQQVADALGIGATSGPIGDVPDAQREPWVIEGEDATLEVFGASWWYSRHLATGGGNVGCEPRPGLDCPHGSEPPAASDPASLPSEDEARAIALDLLAATGLDISDAAVTVNGPHDAWYVEVEPRLGGVPAAGWLASVAVGPDGAITSASGHLSEPELLGDYALLDTHEAIERLNAQASVAAPMPLPAPDVAVADGRAPAGDCAADGPGCMTIDGPAEATEVVLTAAEPVLIALPALDGSGDAYLVPGYRFTGGDGTVVDVPAVADESLMPTPLAPVDPAQPTETVETIVVEPAPPEPGDPAGLEIGVPYYVDVDIACGAFELGGRIWMLEEGSLAGWSEPHEGGRFTLDSPDHGTFVGDAEGAKTATFATGTAGNVCTPTPRR